MFHQTIYASRDTRCKEPFGAVAAGQTIRFSIFPHRETYLRSVVLYIAADGKEAQPYPMTWDGLFGEYDCYTAEFTPETPDLYWYYFSVTGKAQSSYICRGAGGVGYESQQPENFYQLTVYDAEYVVADWFGKGITYNIFPDRFCRTEIPPSSGYRDTRVVHEDWNEIPVYQPNEHGEILNNDFFGGSLKGVLSKLDYLQSLHVQTIYFNPIFEAYSNHRYDTGNYKCIDPMMGTEEDFKTLCAEAKKRGMRVILDGVFSHNGYDSLYFNARGHYDSVGAFQSKNSPYYEWYDFSNWPDQYASWWGIYTLPQVNELNPKYLDYILEDADSVIRRWLRLGASGWRLDVADELPDEFIAKLNRAARREKPDALVVGEVWEDASNKVSYSVRRRYFQGGELDSVMNYPLRDGIMGFLGGAPAQDFAEKMECLKENYPRAVFYNLMNIIGTHDTPRALTVMGAKPEDWNGSREHRASARLMGDALVEARKKLFLAATIQFTMPGSPTIYYGDEAGVQGFEDPFNRRTYPWGGEDGSLLEFYQKLTAVRTAHSALVDGELNFLPAMGDSLLVYERVDAQEHIFVAVNRDVNEVVLRLPCHAVEDLMTEKQYTGTPTDEFAIRIPGQTAMILRAMP